MTVMVPLPRFRIKARCPFGDVTPYTGHTPSGMRDEMLFDATSMPSASPFAATEDGLPHAHHVRFPPFELLWLMAELRGAPGAPVRLLTVGATLAISTVWVGGFPPIAATALWVAAPCSTIYSE